MLKVAINGMKICACNIMGLIGQFKAFLPDGEGWELAESIAPGVFGTQAVIKNPRVEVAV